MDRDSSSENEKRERCCCWSFFSIYCRKGAPMRICDNGREFTNTISKTLQEIHGCKLLFSALYHPQTNGLVKSTHKAIKQSLKNLYVRSEMTGFTIWNKLHFQLTFALVRPQNILHSN